MIPASFVAALLGAALAAQAASGTGNYNGLSKILEPKVGHEVKAAQSRFPQHGRVIEDRSGKIERGPCGMPIIAANAAVDPKMIIPITPGSQKSAEAPADPSQSCGPFAAVPARR